MKVWWKYNNLGMNDHQLCMKMPKKCNKIKGRSVVCSHIWHVNNSKYVYWLDTHSMKVWWRYVLPNTNAFNFCDIIFRHRADLPKKTLSKINNPVTLGSTRIIYRIFSNFSKPLYLIKKAERRQKSNRIPKLPTDRNF